MSTLGGHRLVPIRPSPQRGNEGKPAPYVPSSSQSPTAFSPPNLALKRKFSDEESDDSETESCKRRINFAVNYVVSPQPVSISRRNARERNRVKQVNNGFAALRQHIPSAAKAKKISKVDTLKQAVEYIQNLQQLLAENDEALKKKRQFFNGLCPQLPALPRESAMQGQSSSSFFPDDMNFLLQPCSPNEENISPSSSFSGQISSPELLNSSESPRQQDTKFTFPNQEKRSACGNQFTSFKPTFNDLSTPLEQSSVSILNHTRMKNQNESFYQQSLANPSKHQLHCALGILSNENNKGCLENSLAPADLYVKPSYYDQENSPDKMGQFRPGNSPKEAYGSIRVNALEQRLQCDQENSHKELYQRPQPQAGVHVHSYNRNGPQSVLPVTSDPFRVLSSGFKGPGVVHHFNASNNQTVGQIVPEKNLVYFRGGNKNNKATTNEEDQFFGQPVNTCVVKPITFVTNKPFGSSSNTCAVKPINMSESKQFESTSNSGTMTSKFITDCENRMFRNEEVVVKSMPANEKLCVSSTHPNIKPNAANENKLFGRVTSNNRNLTTNENYVVGIPPKFCSDYALETNCEALSGDLPPNHLTNIDCDIASNFPSFENLEDVYKVIDPTSPLGVEGDLLDAIDLWEKC